MPGRFTLTADSAALRKAFPWLEIPDGLKPRYNIASPQPVAVATNEAGGRFDVVTWGLIPSWSSGVKMTKIHINARGESLGKRPSFRGLYRHKRCLVFADGVYEWLPEKQGRKTVKIPYYYYLESHRPFAFAGLWDSWQSIDGSVVKSCCIITTEPNEVVRVLHHRMGVILHPEDYPAWLSPQEMFPRDLDHLLAPYPPDEIVYHRVASRVTDKRNDDPECIAAVPGEPGPAPKKKA